MRSACRTGLHLPPLPAVELVRRRVLGQLAGGQRPVVTKGLVPAEPPADVRTQRLEGGDTGAEQVLGVLLGRNGVLFDGPGHGQPPVPSPWPQRGGTASVGKAKQPLI